MLILNIIQTTMVSIYIFLMIYMICMLRTYDTHDVCEYQCYLYNWLVLLMLHICYLYNLIWFMWSMFHTFLAWIYIFFIFFINNVLNQRYNYTPFLPPRILEIRIFSPPQAKFWASFCIQRVCAVGFSFSDTYEIKFNFFLIS